MLALMSVSTMITAITVMSVTSLVIPVFASKKHCNESDSTCDTKTAEGGTATQGDESNNDSNIIDEDSDLDGYQTEADNSTSSIDSQTADQFSLVGI
jgi:hypothetical protein